MSPVVDVVVALAGFGVAVFAEYDLIGTLTSFLVAAGLGVAVRAVLGLHPVLAAHP